MARKQQARFRLRAGRQKSSGYCVRAGPADACAASRRELADWLPAHPWRFGQVCPLPRAADQQQAVVCRRTPLERQLTRFLGPLPADRSQVTRSLLMGLSGGRKSRPPGGVLSSKTTPFPCKEIWRPSQTSAQCDTSGASLQAAGASPH